MNLTDDELWNYFNTNNKIADSLLDMAVKLSLEKNELSGDLAKLAVEIKALVNTIPQWIDGQIQAENILSTDTGIYYSPKAKCDECGGEHESCDLCHRCPGECQCIKDD